MNYELAKKLKKVGFPQKGKGILGLFKKRPNASAEEECYVPTLEELIEACGAGTFTLERSQFFIEGQWQAILITENTAVDEFDNSQIHNAYGTTPSESVANLWLKLNEK